MAKNGTGKYGRNKKRCELYRNQRTRDKNKKVRIAKHVKKFPADLMAAETFNAVGKAISTPNAP